MKTRQENDVIDRIGVIYTINNNELSWPIKPGATYKENQTRQWRD